MSRLCMYRALTAITAAVLGACAQQPPPPIHYGGDAPSLAQAQQLEARTLEAARRHPNAQPRVRPQFPEQAPPPLAAGEKLPESLAVTRRGASKLAATYVDWQRPENHYHYRSRYGYGYGYRPLSVGIGWNPYGYGGYYGGGYGYGYGRPYGWGGYGYGYGPRYGYGLSLGLGAPLWGARPSFYSGYGGGWGHRHGFGFGPHVRWMDAGRGRRRW
jgi:hypothetical protein